jgi:transcriptional regulator with XRE-family HTH domain
MAQTGLLVRINARMRDTGATQSDIARACEMSQPHLSKVLRKRVKLAAKTAAKLEGWLVGSAAEQPEKIEPLQSLSAKIASVGPKRRIQIMQLLDAIDRLLV